MDPQDQKNLEVSQARYERVRGYAILAASCRRLLRWGGLYGESVLCFSCQRSATVSIRRKTLVELCSEA